MNAHATVQSGVSDLSPVRAVPMPRLVSDGQMVRTGYQPSRRSAPLALAASLGIVGALGSAFVLLGGPAIVLKKQPPLVVTMELMPAPPPPEAQPVTPPPPTAPLLTAPPPIVRVSTPPAMVAATPVETPPQPIAIAAPAPPVAAVPAPAAPAAAPVDGDLSLNMLDATPPRYPTESRRKREEGTVRLSVLVGQDGRVAEVGVASSSGSDRLDKAALAAVKRWRWSPLKRAGVAMMVRGIVTIPFVLRS